MTELRLVGAVEDAPGVLLYLADARLSRDVETSSSVSGGSITNAALALVPFRDMTPEDVWRFAGRLAPRLAGHLAAFFPVLAFHAAAWVAAICLAAAHEPALAAVTLGVAVALSIVLAPACGDAEAGIWTKILPRLPQTVDVFHVPHHGGRSGVFAAGDATPWLSGLSGTTRLTLGSHVRPHGLPHPDVIRAIEASKLASFRTDIHSHLMARTDGEAVDDQYSHI